MVRVRRRELERDGPARVAPDDAERRAAARARRPSRRRRRSRTAATRARSSSRAARRRARRRSRRAMRVSGLTGKPRSRSQASASWCECERDAVGRADARSTRATAGARPAMRRVELAQRAGRRVARVHERRQALLGALLVEAREGAPRQVDLAAHLDQRRRRRRRGSQRSGIARTVRRLAVTSSPTSPSPRVAPRAKTPSLVDERDREAVDLRLGDVARRLLDAGGRRAGAHALRPTPRSSSLVARVGERQHRLQMAHLAKPLARLAADALRRRVGRDEVRVRLLERAQLAQQRVVGRRRRRRRVVDEVGVVVAADLRAQLARSGRGIGVTRTRPGSRPSSSGVSATRVGAGVPQHARRRATPHVTPTAPQPAARAACDVVRRVAHVARRRPRRRRAARSPSAPAPGSGLWRWSVLDGDDRLERHRRRLDRERQVDRVARLRRDDADRGAGPRAAARARRRRRRSGRSSAAVLAWFQTPVGVEQVLRPVRRRTRASGRSAAGRCRTAAPRREGRGRAPSARAWRCEATISGMVSISVPSRSNTTALQRSSGTCGTVATTAAIERRARPSQYEQRGHARRRGRRS